MLISKKTHCFNCDHGNMIKALSETRVALNCDRCPAASWVVLVGPCTGIVYYTKDRNNPDTFWELGEK